MSPRNIKSARGEDPHTELRPRADEPLGSYLRRIRLVRGMGLSEVADATPKVPESQHISYSYLSQIELGRAQSPSRERLTSIAQVLGLPPQWVLEKAGFTGGAATVAEESSSSSPIVQQIALRAGQLDRTDQEAFLQMINAILRLRRHRRESERRDTKS